MIKNKVTLNNIKNGFQQHKKKITVKNIKSINKLVKLNCIVSIRNNKVKLNYIKSTQFLPNLKKNINNYF